MKMYDNTWVYFLECSARCFGVICLFAQKSSASVTEISLVNTIIKWETQHRPYIEQLEIRALRLAKGDLVPTVGFMPRKTCAGAWAT